MANPLIHTVSSSITGLVLKIVERRGLRMIIYPDVCVRARVRASERAAERACVCASVRAATIILNLEILLTC